MYRILIIEDEEELRENYREIFEQSGNKTYLAANGFEGVKMAADLIPDLILCDITMPGLDGFQVKDKLSKNNITQIIPFIFLTAKADIKYFREGMSLGADDYITKPVRNNELLKIVYDRLQRIEKFRFKSADNTKSIRLTIEDKILLNFDGEHLIIPLKDILFIEVMGNYTVVNLVDQKKAIQKKSLKSWEEILPEKDFIRVHHKTIINFNFVGKIQPLFNGSMIIKMNNYPESIVSSKRYSQRIKKIFHI